jgi:hypothetical protein
VTGRSAALQGGLAALGLLAAHLTWQREPERAPGEVTVIDASKADIARITFEDEDNALGLERRTGNGDPVMWLHLEEKAKQVLPANPKDPMPPPTPPSTPPRNVKGNEDAVKVFDKFTPFVSPRAFGVMEGAKLKELGLDAPKRHLAVWVRGDVRKYDIGIAMNAQNNESFLRDPRDGRVYLMPRGLLADLTNGKRLVDPRLHLFDTKEFDRIVVVASGKRKEFLHQGRENFSTEGYAPARTPDKRDQMAKNWHDMLWRTFPMEVMGKDEVPKEGPPKIVLRVDYFEGKKPVGWIELGRTENTGSKATSEDKGPAENLFARSEHSAGWAKLHASDQLVLDAERLVAAP